MHIGIRYACTFLFPLESQQNYFDYKVMADIKKCPGSDFHDWAPKKELFRWLNSHRIYFSSIPVNSISIIRLLQFISLQIKKIFLNIVWKVYWYEAIFKISSRAAVRSLRSNNMWSFLSMKSKTNSRSKS